MEDKLNNFPPVYYISLSDSTDRQRLFGEQFLLNGIENVKMIEAYDGRKEDYKNKPDIVDGLHFESMDSGAIAATISHLKAIIEWYYNSDSEYAIFFEDDMTIESINYWNFNWQEFVKELPKDWNVIQLSLIKSEIQESDMKLNYRNWDINWSAGSYLIKKTYAKKLIDLYFNNEKYFLKVEYNEETIPCIETILFSPAVKNAYTIPLFYENINFASTFYPHFIQSTHKETQIESSNYVRYWWKIKGKELFLGDLKI
jgi:GR25 family glycosyltransferase involved in LPS biosynthesis